MHRKARTPEMEAEERQRDRTVPEDAGRYLRARLILNDLREKHLAGKISYQVCRELRERALGGDVDGASEALEKELKGQVGFYGGC